MGALSLLMATCPGALEVGWMACDDESGQWRSKRHTVDARAGSAQEMEGVNGERDHSPTDEPGYPAKKSRGSDEHLRAIAFGGWVSYRVGGRVRYLGTWVGLLHTV